MLLREVLQKTTDFLKDKGSESARLDSELLISTALNWERIKLYINYDYPLSETEVSACRELVRRRAAGEPVAYILGRKDFYNHSFAVTPDVLIPRPETETLVEEAIGWGKKNSARLVIDLGCGSGCIGLSIIAELPDARLIGVDVSAGAIAVAAENAKRLGLEDRVKFVTQDAAEFARDWVEEAESADVVVANPPYIAESDPQVDANVRRYEPAGALFSPDEGLAHVRDWAKAACGLARRDGYVMFEIGHRQGISARDIFERTEGFQDIKVVKDLSGKDRFVRAIRL